jgi:hypothetical protein
MPVPIPSSLLPNRLMAHMRVLCKEIGPRPLTSEQERRAAAYVKQTLGELGVTDIVEQPFQTHRTLGQTSLPFCIATALAFPLGWLFGVPGKWLGSALAALSLREALRFLAGRFVPLPLPPITPQPEPPARSVGTDLHLPKAGQALIGAWPAG